MYPPREIDHKALRSDSGPLDPLTVARQIEVDVTEVERWKVEKIFDVRGGTLAILTVSNPSLVGMILCLDRGFERECVRLGPDGLPLAVVVGSRIGPVMSLELTPVDVVNLESATTPAQMYELVDRLQGRAVLEGVPLDDALTLSMPTINLDDEEVR